MRAGHVISALAALALGAGGLIAATPASAGPQPGGAVDCDFAVTHMGDHSGWTITCYQGSGTSAASWRSPARTRRRRRGSP
ncbi:hypothetical protein ACFO3J_25310 [Streptomyces polygonati]|uniref:Secreted protein n=1 Tax=Streptomyces polygonati TaxID=1617087 RepID=A0ABV8HRU2_9ACTN